MRDTVLVLSASTVGDDGVDAVIAHLARRGRRVVNVDSAGFPLDQRLSLDLDGARWADAPLPAARDALTGTPVDSVNGAAIAAVWYRHLDVAAALHERLDPTWIEAVATQAERALWAFGTSLPGLHVDHPDRSDLVPGSPGILRLGRAAGLDVPRTLVSNDPVAVRAFVATCRAGAVRKMLHSSSIVVRTADGARRGSTEAVDPADLVDDSGIAACPLVWQERVEKARELRVTAVGRELFVASVDPSGSTTGAVDWRQDPALVASFAPDTLPPAVEAAVHRLLDRLRLNFATLDIIRTPDGRHVLLEVNTTSFFAFVERATGLPIADALAALLAGERPARVPWDD